MGIISDRLAYPNVCYLEKWCSWTQLRYWRAVTSCMGSNPVFSAKMNNQMKPSEFFERHYTVNGKKVTLTEHEREFMDNAEYRKEMYTQIRLKRRRPFTFPPPEQWPDLLKKQEDGTTKEHKANS